MRKQHIIIIAIALSLVFAVTACSKQASQTSTNLPGQTTATVTDQPTEPIVSVSPPTAPEEINRSSPLFHIHWDGESWRGRLIGEIKDNQICAFDSADITVDGKPVSDELRESLTYNADGVPAYTAALTYAEIGQVYQLYDAWSGAHAGTCQLTSMQYHFETANGNDMLECEFTSRDAYGESGWYYAMAGLVDMQPRIVHEELFEGGDGRYYLLTADIDDDGADESLSWDMSTRDDFEAHKIFVTRGSERLCTVDFWYDYDFTRPEEFAYTTPLNPMLLDLNGDGVYELILQTYGHNSYLIVYTWENDEYIRTGAGYYSGD